MNRLFPLLAALLSVGCPAEEPQPICDPGETQACWCEADLPGTQTCNGDGMDWSYCDCPAPQDDDDDDDDVVVDAQIDVTPDSLVFDDVGIGCSLTKYVSVINVGADPLLLTDVEIVSNDDEFRVELDVPLDTPLASGTVAQATVEYAPLNETGDTASLFIRSNDPTNPEVHVGITGSFTGSALVVDEFVQVPMPWVDVLWVLDNSSSMSDEQDFLKSVIPTFLDVAAPAPALIHLGVITTDDGELIGSPNVLTTDMPDVFDQFSERIAVGTDGSEPNLGLQMGSQAITPPLAAPGGVNDGFLREAAGLLVIVVSDSEDESADTTNAYASLFHSLKVDPEQVKVVSVTGGLSGCAGAIAAAEAEVRFSQVASLTDGAQLSICDPAWMEVLATLDWERLGWGWTFELSREPEAETIEVEVGGVGVTEGWSYDESYNAVLFEEAGLPGAGVGIVVRYVPVPEC